MALHKNLAIGDIHVPYQWEYANSAARTGASGFVSGDVGKLARQLDDNTLWQLIATTPTWLAVGAGVAPTAHAASHRHGGSDEVSTLTPTANAIPKADGSSKLDSWVTSNASGGTPSLRQLGTGATDACAGNDSRLSNARTPTSHASTHNAGGADVLAIDAVAGTGSLRTLGTSATAACAGNDARLSDDRTSSGLRTASGIVSVSAATAPAAGQVLKATSGTVATWQNDNSGVSLASVAPANVTKAIAAVGVGTTAARDDHKHDVTTAAAVANPPGTSNAEGSATSLARSDHTHQMPAYGSAVSTICQGNDSRLSDSRTPTAHASTHNAGGADALAIDSAAGTGSLRTLGTAATSACAGSDSRLSDARTPTSHATSHKSGGSDSVKLDELAAPTDITTLNATTGQHGLLPKLGGGTTNFLRADGTWATPAAGGSVFGQDAQDAESLGTSTTTGTNQTKVTLTTPSLPAGRYRIGWSCEATLTSSISADFLVDVLLDGTTTLADVNIEPKDQSGNYPVSGFAHVDLSAASHTILLRYGSEGGHTASIRNARLEIWRVA